MQVVHRKIHPQHFQRPMDFDDSGLINLRRYIHATLQRLIGEHARKRYDGYFLHVKEWTKIGQNQISEFYPDTGSLSQTGDGA